MRKIAHAKPKLKKLDDDAWIKDHFEKIVDKYGGQHIIVCQGKIFTGDKALKEAKRKYPRSIPTSMPVPRPEEFVHVLIICRNQ